MPKAPVER